MRRFLRIFPLYYALLLVWFGVLASAAARMGWDAHAIGRDRQLWYWSYLSNWMLPGHEPVGAIAHLWSLAVEEQFYLVWPLLVWLLPTRALMVVSAIVVIATPAFRGVLLLRGVPSDAIYEWTVTRMDALALGGVVALALRSPTLHAIVVRCCRPLMMAAGAILVGVLWRYGRVHFHDGWVGVLGFSILALLCATLVSASVLDAEAPIARAFTWSPLRTLGRYSYCIYVIHFPFFCIAQQRLMQSRWKTGLQTPLGYVAFMVVGMTTVYGLARLSWSLFEAPLLQLKRYFIAERGEAAPRGLADQ
jgi:peptidoglycan/LPS O-acetylase OafA/YrhL